MMREVEVGKVTHYWGHIAVAGVHMGSQGLRVGDTVHIVGHTTDLTQAVASIQVEHESVQEAKPGQDVGLRVSDHVHEHDTVFKLVND